MVYKITFYRFDISAQDWSNFLLALASAVCSFRIVMLRYGKQIDFYILSSKKIDVINHRIFPFYLSDDLRNEELALLKNESAKKRFLPMWLKFGLIRTMEKNALKGKALYKMYFDYHKYNPFRDFPFIKIFYLKNQKKRQALGLNFKTIQKFLSFCLSNTINSEIARVKPQLICNDLKFPLYQNGILNIKNVSDQIFGQLSVCSYDFNRHTLIVGQSGSGKSTFLKLLLEDLYAKMGHEYCVVLVDPHATLAESLKTIPSHQSIDFKNVATNLFININQPNLSTELTLDLFSPILAAKENQSMHRVLKYALRLLYSIDCMSIDNLKNLLTDSLVRKEFLKKTQDRTLLQFFETEYQQLFTSKYTEAILPIINLLSELDFIKSAPSTTGLTREMNDNFLVSFPIQQSALGKTITKIIGGALIQQVFTIAQAGLVRKKIVLVIDEVSIIQNPSLVHILSEARKFGLTIILSQQYLMQVPLEVLQSIFANIVNYFVFKASRDDAEMLSRNLNCMVDEFSKLNKDDPREVLEIATKILMDLNPQELVVRVLAENNFCSPFKAKTININN